MTPAPHEPSEFEKLKHHHTHIPFQPWCTSCVKGKAQAEPHKRTERIVEDSELQVIQCHYLMLKDVASTGGLKVLSMYVRTLGYGMSRVVDVKAQQIRSQQCGLSDIILHCDPEPSLIKVGRKCPNDQNEPSFEVLPDGHIKATVELKTVRNSCRDVRTKLAAMQERTHCRPTADSALKRWIVRHAVWLIPRFRGGDVQSPFYRALGRPYRGKLVEFGETVLAHLPEVGKGSGNPAPKLAAGKERLNRRAPCLNGRWSCVCAKSTTTRREQLVRREPQVSHRDSTETEVNDNQQIPEQCQKYVNT